MKILLAAAFMLCALPVEQMVTAMLPQEKLDAAAGFFAPVTKRYMPVFQQFGAEYEAAPNKLPVIAKYLPRAESALAEARRMQVPPRFEQEKAQYIRLFDMVLASARLSVRLAGLKTGAQAPVAGPRR